MMSTGDAYHGVCWHCTYGGAEEWKAVPVSVEPSDFFRRLRPSGKATLNVSGYFCSNECAFSWLDGLDEREAMLRRSMLHELVWSQLPEGKEFLVRRAPCRYRLKKFGGDLTIEQFRELSKRRSLVTKEERMLRVKTHEGPVAKKKVKLKHEFILNRVMERAGFKKSARLALT